VRDTSGMALYFVIYESMRRSLIKNFSKENDSGTREVSPVSTALAGATAGLLSWVLIYPADVVKTRCQAHPPEAGTLSFMGVYRQVMAEPSSWRGFFRGVHTCAIRAVPVNAVTFAVYEYIMSLKNH